MFSYPTCKIRVNFFNARPKKDQHTFLVLCSFFTDPYLHFILRTRNGKKKTPITKMDPSCTYLGGKSSAGKGNDTLVLYPGLCPFPFSLRAHCLLTTVGRPPPFTLKPLCLPLSTKLEGDPPNTWRFC